MEAKHSGCKNQEKRTKNLMDRPKRKHMETEHLIYKNETKTKNLMCSDDLFSPRLVHSTP